MLKNKIYLDTNIVADMIDSSREGHDSSIAFLKESVTENYILCVSEDMLSTLYYISKNKRATLDFFKNIIFMDWKIVSFGKEVIEHAVSLSLEKELDLEDIFQCLCAKKSECKTLITNDNEFYDCGITIVTTEKFLIQGLC